MIQVAAGIIWNQGKILLARRKRGKTLAGFWEFPGGKIEEGELPQQALYRELIEEFGIVVAPSEIFATNCHAYDHAEIELIAVEAKYVSGYVTLTDHDNFAWVLPRELDSFMLSAADVPVAKMLMAR